MKDLERRFFRFCCKQIDYSDIIVNNNQFGLVKSFGKYVDMFSEKHNCSSKQLVGYIWKWESKRLINWGVNVLYGWFEFDFDKMPEQYKKIIPRRVLIKIAIAKNKCPESFISNIGR